LTASVAGVVPVVGVVVAGVLVGEVVGGVVVGDDDPLKEGSFRYHLPSTWMQAAVANEDEVRASDYASEKVWAPEGRPSFSLVLAAQSVEVVESASTSRQALPVTATRA
jgi:hypothetical protein